MVDCLGQAKYCVSFSFPILSVPACELFRVVVLVFFVCISLCLYVYVDVRVGATVSGPLDLSCHVVLFR